MSILKISSEELTMALKDLLITISFGGSLGNRGVRHVVS